MIATTPGSAAAAAVSIPMTRPLPIGVRVRDYPITLDKIIDHLPSV